jgi:DnaJ-class molecular chaperone
MVYLNYIEKRKSVYDKYGYETLKHGMVFDGEMVGYAFDGNSESIFESFFGSSNPYT